MDDPFAMMAGMGEEEVYKVTLMEDNEEKEGEEEEEAAGDMDDPFAMMAGMGEEEVYKVTLVEDSKEETKKEEKVVEEKDSASQDQQKVDDSAGMQGAMAAEFLAQRE